MSRLAGQKGFTLVELMLAMALFSVILIITTTGFIGINRTYSRGVIKKQLSESIQKIVDDVTLVLQVPQPVRPVMCSGSGAEGCPEVDGYNILCFTGVRYYWPIPLADNDGGLFRDNEPCSNAPSSNTAQRLLDSRFVVEDLRIVAVSGSRELYNIKGIIHTNDMEALTMDDSQTTADRSKEDFNPYSLRCKGSSAGSVVQTCAVEQFEITVSSRGKI